MPGSSGSKYGIIEDEIPLRDQKRFIDTTKRSECDERTNLKDLRLVVRRFWQNKNSISRQIEMAPMSKVFLWNNTTAEFDPTPLEKRPFHYIPQFNESALTCLVAQDLSMG